MGSSDVDGHDGDHRLGLPLAHWELQAVHESNLRGLTTSPHRLIRMLSMHSWQEEAAYVSRSSVSCSLVEAPLEVPGPMKWIRRTVCYLPIGLTGGPRCRIDRCVALRCTDQGTYLMP